MQPREQLLKRLADGGLTEDEIHTVIRLAKEQALYRRAVVVRHNPGVLSEGEFLSLATKPHLNPQPNEWGAKTFPGFGGASRRSNDDD